MLKLHLLAGGDINGRRNDIDGQISLYERGIGGKTKSSVIKALRFAGGDLSRQTKPMRKQLEKVYEKGDTLYVLGFSRGSAAARKFTVQLYENGLMTKHGEMVEQPPIELLGCFDTVAMQVKKRLIKVLRTRCKNDITPSTVLGEDGKVVPTIKKAVHNVSLDDNRQWDPIPPMPPVLMGAEERVHEAWFAGEHGDSGGYFYSKGIPDCSCVYMKEWMESAGLEFMEADEINEECLKIDDYPDIEIPAAHLILDPDPKDKLHLVKQQIENPSYRPVHVVENDEKVQGATVNIHESVLLHMEAMKEKNDPYSINPNLKGADLVVVGSMGKVSDEKTKRLNTLLESDY